VYTCPIRRLALASHAGVHRYLYTHVYDNSPDPVITAAGAAHFFDEPILWHDADLLYPGYQFSADEELLADRMAGYWTNFAKTGNPNGPALESWSPFAGNAENIKVLDEPAGDLIGYHKTQCAFLDQIPNLLTRARDYTPSSVKH
jgi:carboxylesterase type B